MELTARELMLMVNGKRKEAWSHTSALIALVHNALSKEPKNPEDFNPYAEAEAEKLPKVKVKDLKKIFFDDKMKFKGIK